MSDFEVPNPILNKPFEEPKEFWYIREGHPPEPRKGRRPAMVFPPRDQRRPWDITDGALRPSDLYPAGYELPTVNLIRERVKQWRADGYPGATRTTDDLLKYWSRDGRKARLFFAQREAAETIIFLKEARENYLQGINVLRDEPSDDRKAEGFSGFERLACKMATGSGKTTVMAMLAAWSILNKVNDRSDARFSDTILIVCPNVTIRDRLTELDPSRGEASLYRTRDIIPERLKSQLAQGRVIVTNWHVFQKQQPQTGGTSAKVSKRGVPDEKKSKINISDKNTTARGKRYLTLEDFHRQVDAGMLEVVRGSEELDNEGNLKSVQVKATAYVESDTALINRVLEGVSTGKRNILVMNDEAHHAYRIKREEPDDDEEEDLFGEEEEADEFFKEANVWMDGLDRLNKIRGLNFCVDLSATPYFLGRVGQDTNKPFPWVVSDFGLIDAIESGLTKIPQLAVRDTTGAEIPGYFNIWRWIMDKLTPAERGGKRASPKPAAILKFAHPPIAMLGSLWQSDLETQLRAKDDSRPPVFILVCKNIKIAKALHDWLAEGNQPPGIPDCKIEGFRNRDGRIFTIRVDSKVVEDGDGQNAVKDETRWLRFTLDTVGRVQWPADSQGRPIYPEGFEEVAKKLKKPLHPPGRDIRCIVSVGMLTEGWDCNTVTHIVGLRPFMSQLLCEQVVGRGLRRKFYELDEDGKFPEEVAKVFGVPFEVVPFKATKGVVIPPEKRHHIYAEGSKSKYEITFPRVEGYTQAVRNKITVNWDEVPTVVLEPGKIPPEVQMKNLSVNNSGRLSLSGPGALDDVDLVKFREKLRFQELVFDIARGLVKHYCAQPRCEVPAHALFPQMKAIVERFLLERVKVLKPADLKDVFLSPYYGWVVEALENAIRPDTKEGEAPEVPEYETGRETGSTREVDFMTSRDVREAVHCHLSAVVMDTKTWEQSAAYYIDTHPMVDAFVKNAGMGFAIPYMHNGQGHDYMPDFIVRLKQKGEDGKPHCLILETKGFDPLAEVKQAAAFRWVKAVNADGQYGTWVYDMARKPEDVRACIDRALETSGALVSKE